MLPAPGARLTAEVRGAEFPRGGSGRATGSMSTSFGPQTGLGPRSSSFSFFICESRQHCWFPGGSDVESLPAVQETRVGKIPRRRNWQPTPALLPGKAHGQRSRADYSPWGCTESNITEQLTVHLESRGPSWIIAES